MYQFLKGCAVVLGFIAVILLIGAGAKHYREQRATSASQLHDGSR